MNEYNQYCIEAETLLFQLEAQEITQEAFSDSLKKVFGNTIDGIKNTFTKIRGWFKKRDIDKIIDAFTEAVKHEIPLEAKFYKDFDENDIVDIKKLIERSVKALKDEDSKDIAEEVRESINKLKAKYNEKLIVKQKIELSDAIRMGKLTRILITADVNAKVVERAGNRAGKDSITQLHAKNILALYALMRKLVNDCYRIMKALYNYSQKYYNKGFQTGYAAGYNTGAASGQNTVVVHY